MEPVRLLILYSGAVQGVGFRWTAAAALKHAPITGYVTNLPDGRVELLLEGTPEDTEDAARRVREALAHCIRGESRETTAATGEFTSFGIRR
jgi:acylphosphatase